MKSSFIERPCEFSPDLPDFQTPNVYYILGVLENTPANEVIEQLVITGEADEIRLEDSVDEFFRFEAASRALVSNQNVVHKRLGGYDLEVFCTILSTNRRVRACTYRFPSLILAAINVL